MRVFRHLAGQDPDLTGYGGGGGGIRTRDTVSRIHTFQACAFDRSATPPARAEMDRARARGDSTGRRVGASNPCQPPPSERWRASALRAPAQPATAAKSLDPRPLASARANAFAAPEITSAGAPSD